MDASSFRSSRPFRRSTSSRSISRALPVIALLALAGCGEKEPAGPSPEALRDEIKRELKEELRDELKSELRREMIAERPTRRGPPPIDPRQPVRPDDEPRAQPAPVRPARPVEVADEPEPIRAPAPPAEPEEPAEEPLAEPADEPEIAPADPTPSTSLLELDRLVVARDVADRAPVEPGVNFDAAEVPKLFAFVEVKNPGDDSHVTIEWLYRGDVKSRMELKVGHSTRGWRTWSSTRVTPKLVGNWTVRVLDPAGTVIGNTAFAIR